MRRADEIPHPTTFGELITGTNGIAERAVRRVKEGTATAIVQSGLRDDWWDCAMECFGAKSQLQAHVFERRDKAAWNLAKRCLPESSRDTCYVRREDGQAICLRDLQRLASLTHPRQPVQAPGSRTRRKAVVPWSSIFLNSHAAKRPPGETLSKMKKKRRRPFSKKKTENTIGAGVVASSVAVSKYVEQSCPSRKKQLSPFQ